MKKSWEICQENNNYLILLKKLKDNYHKYEEVIEILQRIKRIAETNQIQDEEKIIAIQTILKDQKEVL